MDRSIIQKAIGGSSEAFEVLYRETHDKGYSVAYSVLKDSYEAEDILQEAYISMYQKIDTLKNPNGFESWFYRIVKNEALDFLRKQRPEVFSSFENSDTDDFNFEDTIVSDYAPFDPEENVDYEDTKRIMAEIVDSLPDMQKRCIQFRFQKDMKISEIASSLEIPESTVKSNLTYGKKKIEEEVKKLEKKGVRLYSVAPALLIPFLRWMYGNQVPATLTSAAASAAGTVVAETASIVTEATSAVEAAIGGSTATATTGATTGVATAAAKTGISALATKIIAGVCAVALVGGGAAFAAQRSDRSDSTDHTESTDVVIDGTEITDVSASDKPISATEDADGLIPMVSKHMTFYLPTEQVKGPVTGGEDGEIYGYTLNNGISIIADLVRHDLGAEEFSSTYECAQYYVDEVYYVDVPIETRDGLYYFSRSHERSHSTNIVTFIEGPSGRLVVTGACDTDDFEQLKEEIWGYILTATPYWEKPADTKDVSGASIVVYEAYKQVLQQYEAACEWDLSEHPEALTYTLYDIDKDGLAELIVTDYLMNYVYTMQNDTAILCGEAAGYWGIWACEDNGVIFHDGGLGSMRIESMSRYTLSNGILEHTGESVCSGLADTADEFYSWQNTYKRIDDSCPVNDYSLLEKFFANK